VRIPLAAAVLALLTTSLPAQREVVQQDPLGNVRERYTVDDQGKKQGPYEQRFADGSPEVRANYTADQLDGRYERFAADGKPLLVAFYKAGLQDGAWREFAADGKKLRWLSYQAGVLHGRCEEFLPDGRAASAGDYREGKRLGKWLFLGPGDKDRTTAEYRDDLLHGPRTIERGGKITSHQKWKDGELLQLDQLQPFPLPQPTLRQQLTACLQPPALLDTVKEPRAAERAAALRLLQTYRCLCRLPHADMRLVPQWNDLCDAAAEVCEQNGELDHHPPQPPGMPEPRYQQGRTGAGNSNLSAGSGIEGSVDSYMDDSDSSNIDRVGHRRWCLNPSMLKTGFGGSGSYSAMWSMDSSGPAVKGLAAVLYPPAGWCPVDLFGARRAFSISLLRSGVPRADDLQVHIRAFDDDWLVTGEPLALDYCALAGGGYGGSQCLVFRAKDFVVRPGKSYLVEVSTDRGKSMAFRYVVAFCAPVRPERQ